MSQQPDSSEQQSEGEQQANSELFIYKDSGIQEKHGYVPAWLWVVAVVMVVWAVYYTMKYWVPPVD